MGMARHMARVVGWFTMGGFDDDCGHHHDDYVGKRFDAAERNGGTGGRGNIGRRACDVRRNSLDELWPVQFWTEH